MKKIYYFLVLFGFSISMMAQTVAINEDLLGQHTKNNGVRVASGYLQQERFKKAKEAYDKTNEYSIQILAVKQKIFDSMTNLENAFLNGKQMTQIMKDGREVIDEVRTLQENLFDSPDFLVFRMRYLQQMWEQILAAVGDVYNQVSVTRTDHLIDHYQRQKLLNTIQGRILHIRNQLRGLNFLLRNYKNYNLLRKMPTLNHYVNKDKAMFQSILQNYDYLINGY